MSSATARSGYDTASKRMQAGHPGFHTSTNTARLDVAASAIAATGSSCQMIGIRVPHRSRDQVDTAADRNLDPGNEPGKIRGEECHDISDIIWNTQMTKRCATRRHQSSRNG